MVITKVCCQIVYHHVQIVFIFFPFFFPFFVGLVTYQECHSKFHIVLIMSIQWLPTRSTQWPLCNVLSRHLGGPWGGVLWWKGSDIKTYALSGGNGSKERTNLGLVIGSFNLLNHMRSVTCKVNMNHHVESCLQRVKRMTHHNTLQREDGWWTLSRLIIAILKCLTNGRGWDLCNHKSSDRGGFWA